MTDREAGTIPGYWPHESTGVLQPAVEAYLRGGPMTSGQVAVMRLYLDQWIKAPLWVGPEVDTLRAAVALIGSRDDVAAWIGLAIEAGIDPL